MSHAEAGASKTSPSAAVAVLFLTGLTLPAFSQGETGFLRGNGRLDLATSYSLDTFDEYFLGSSPFAPPIDGVERQLLGLYAAYGLRDDLDLTLNAAYSIADADDDFGFERESDPGDAALQVKWRFYESTLGFGRLSWLLAPGVRFPITDYTTFSDNALNGLGEGDTVLLARTIVQVEWRASYAALETGYDHQSGRLDDEIPVHLSVGIALGGRATLQAFTTNLIALGDAVSNPVFSEEDDGFLRYGLSAYVRISERLGL